MNWEMVELGALAKLITGKTPPTGVNDFFGGTILWVNPGDLKERDIYETDRTLTQSAIDAGKCNVIPANSVLLNCIGNVGKVGIIKKIGCTNQQITALVPTGKILTNYLYYCLLNNKRALMNLANDAVLAILNNDRLRTLKIPLPPLPTQLHISEILDKADSLRKKDQLLLKHYNDLSQSLFTNMFGDPVKNEKGWEVKKLGELSTRISSGNTPLGGSSVYVSHGVTFFRSQNVWKNELIYEDIAYIDDTTHAKMKNTSLMNLDILITKTGRINTENSSLGRAALFTGKDNSANINGHVYLIRLKKGHCHRFILNILTSIEYREHIRNVCVGGIDKRQLNKEHIQDFPIIYPPIELQNQFAEQFKNIEQQKQKVKEQMQESENLFRALLQQAFNGSLN